MTVGAAASCPVANCIVGKEVHGGRLLVGIVGACVGGGGTCCGGSPAAAGGDADVLASPVKLSISLPTNSSGLTLEGEGSTGSQLPMEAVDATAGEASLSVACGLLAW